MDFHQIQNFKFMQKNDLWGHNILVYIVVLNCSSNELFLSQFLPSNSVMVTVQQSSIFKILSYQKVNPNAEQILFFLAHYLENGFSPNSIL